MTLRRCLGAGLLIAFLAPLALSAPAERPGAAPHRTAAGAACCGAPACCAVGNACATGACDPDAPPSSQGPRLGAACPGPTQATLAGDLDPMLAASTVAPHIPDAPASIVSLAAASKPSRGESPAVPPPRA